MSKDTDERPASADYTNLGADMFFRRHGNCHDE